MQQSVNTNFLSLLTKSLHGLSGKDFRALSRNPCVPVIFPAVKINRQRLFRQNDIFFVKCYFFLFIHGGICYNETSICFHQAIHISE